MNSSISSMTETDLLKLYADVLEELMGRNVIRTRNNLCSCYAEWLAQERLGMVLENNSKAGFDAKKHGKKYEIKSRRFNKDNRSRQLSPLRNFYDSQFDFLVAIFFNYDFSIAEAYQISYPFLLSVDHSPEFHYHEHVNGHIARVKKEWLTQKGVIDITNLLLLQQ